MRVIYHQPWFWSFLKLFFSEMDWNKTILTIGGKTYTKEPLTDWQLAHEECHSSQQGAFWPAYLVRYVISASFRLKCEIEAFQAEWRCLQGMAVSDVLKRAKLESMAETLSGPLYGNLITKEEAKEKICA